MSHRQHGGGTAIRQDVGSGVLELVGDPGRPGAWTLLVDGTPQSHVDLEDPQYLEFEYMRRLGHLVDLAAPAGEPLRVLHLGAGGLTLARYVAATRPGSRQLAIESDAGLAEVVRRHLPLGQPGGRRASGSRASGSRASGSQASGSQAKGSQAKGSRASGVRVRIGDARAVLEQLPAGSFDLVVADLFAGARTPAHLTSAEFTAAAARALRPSGIYAANVGDGAALAHTRARVATACSVLPHVCLIADAAVLRGRRFGNLVVAAARHGLPVDDLARRAAGDPFPGRLIHGGELGRFAAGASPITDAQAEPSPAPPPDIFTVRRQSARAASSRAAAQR